MKKLLKSFFALATLAVLTFQIGGCKKDCPAPTTTTYPIQGLWIGTYQTDQVSHQPLFYSLVIYPDGTLIVKTKGNPPAQAEVFANGTWTLTGDVFKFTSSTINYSSVVKQAGTFKFSNTGTLTGGVWQNLTGDNGVFYTGTFPSMTRVN
jgi:hypothetical protein